MSNKSDMPNLAILWDRYVHDGDAEALVLAAERESNAQSALESLLLRAVVVRDWILAAMIERRGVMLPMESDILFSAISECNDAPDVIEWLLERGASIEYRGFNNWTILHFASRNGYKRVVQVLLKRGADVNSSTNVDGGWTPLMESAAAGHLEIVEQLLANGADFTIINTFLKGSARDIAQSHGHQEIVALLDQWPKS